MLNQTQKILESEPDSVVRAGRIGEHYWVRVERHGMLVSGGHGRTLKEASEMALGKDSDSE